MKVRRIIDQLRAHYGGKWTYDRKEMRWIHETGWYVYKIYMVGSFYTGSHYYTSRGERAMVMDRKEADKVLETLMHVHGIRKDALDVIRQG